MTERGFFMIAQRVRQFAAAAALTAFAAVANSGTISFIPDGTFDASDDTLIFGALTASGTNNYVGTLTITDASITQLVANVNALPSDVTFNGVTLNNGSIFATVVANPAFPNMPGALQSITMLFSGLSAGAWTFTINATDPNGASALSGQIARVPVPGTLGLLGLGLVGLGLARRRQQAV